MCRCYLVGSSDDTFHGCDVALFVDSLLSQRIRGLKKNSGRTGITLFRIFVLWDRSATILRFLVLGIVVAYTITIPFVVLFSRDAHGM